jgi:hypothetical protein
MVRKDEIPKAIKNPKNAVKVARVRLDNVMGKLLFKNTAGLEANFKGIQTQSKIKKTRKKNISLEKENHNIKKLRNDGFVDLGHILDESLLEKIKEKYEMMIEDEKYSFVRSEFEGKVYSRMINQIGEKIPELKDLLTDEIKKMISEYYEGNFQVIYVTMWRNYHVPTEISSKKELFSSNWHCDGGDSTVTTLFINISDVTEDQGPFRIVSSGRTKELVKMGFKSRYDYKLSEEIMEDPKHVVKHIGTMGSTVWGNTIHCLHRASNPKLNQHRDILQFRFVPSNEPLNENWILKCQDSASEIRQNKSNISNMSIT